MENKQVMITNMIKSRVGINVPELNLKRVWEKRGAKKPIAMDLLSQAMYDPGVEYLFKEGILKIDEKEVRIALGLETEEEPLLEMPDENTFTRMMTVMPFFDFKDKVSKMPKEHVDALVDFSIEHELTAFDKCTYLKELTQIDIISAVQLARQAKEV